LISLFYFYQFLVSSLSIFTGRETLFFNVTTFLEELVTHTGGIIFGPLFAIPSVLISGKVGAQITGFWPGVINHDG